MKHKFVIVYECIQKDRMEVDKIDAEEYLSGLIDKYQNLIFSICLKITKDHFIAEDLMQETFLSAFEHRDTFQGGNEKAWICRIATNKCFDYQKKAERRAVPTEETRMLPEVHVESTPELLYLDKEAREQLLQECRQLKPPYGEIAVLYFYEEKNPDEIAILKRKKVKTVQTQIYRARKMLKKIYGEEREEYE